MSTELFDRYVAASASFGRQVADVGDEEWDLPTPCADWDIRSVVAHVVLGESQVPEYLAGRASEIAVVDASVLGPGPMSVWRGTALAAIEALRDAPLDLLVPHPLGELTVETVLGFRITDNLVHAWDLATARSVPHEIDEDAAAWTLDFWAPLAESLSGSGYFGPMTQPRDERAGSRLLALLGR